MCVTTNNAELFLMPSRLKSHIIFVLDKAAVRGTGKLSSVE